MTKDDVQRVAKKYLKPGEVVILVVGEEQEILKGHPDHPVTLTSLGGDRYTQLPLPLRPFRTTGAMLLKAAPVALVLFLFFPRLAGSLWGAPSAKRGLSGLTDEMSPGDISDLTLNDVVAFRVRFDDSPPPPPLRYWRGTVLSEFDGYTWSRGGAQFFFLPPVRHEGAPVDYTVTLEPTGQHMLFALDMVQSWTPRLASASRTSVQPMILPDWAHRGPSSSHGGRSNVPSGR